jgi:hypothetical protein
LGPLSAQYISLSPPGSKEVSDSLKIEWPKTVWFGKHKVRIGTYASCVLKTGITSSSNKVQVGGREELMSKEPFKVELEDSLGRKFTAEGTWHKTSGVWTPSNGLLSGFLNMDIQEETYSADPSDLEILSAELHDAENPHQTWQLKVTRIQSTGVIRNELDAFLSDGARIILIEGPVSPEGAAVGESRSSATYYTFVENGVVLARVNRTISKIAFAKDLPGATRSLLLSAAINL